jgi:hypothetical protein
MHPGICITCGRWSRESGTLPASEAGAEFTDFGDTETIYLRVTVHAGTSFNRVRRAPQSASSSVLIDPVRISKRSPQSIGMPMK